jgi:hypothetical protein
LSEETHGGPVNPEALRFVMDAKADYLSAAFVEMRHKYGSVEGYIETVLCLDSFPWARRCGTSKSLVA